ISSFSSRNASRPWNAAWRSPSPNNPKNWTVNSSRRLEDAVQLRRAELLHAADRGDIAPQILKLIVTDGNAEVLPGDVFDFVSFVEYHGVVFGEDAALVGLVAEREVGEEQVMVDDDDIAFLRALVHQGQEAALKVGALLPGAHVAAGIELGPGGAVLGQLLDFGAVAELGGLLPLADDLEIGDLFQPGEYRLLIGVVNFLRAGVVIAALHVADLERPRKMLLKERHVLKEELFLQILGAGGDHDALARKQRRDQIGERFSRARAGLDNQMPFFGEGRFHGFGHLHLALTELIVRVPFGERAVPGKELPRARGPRLNGHGDSLILTVGRNIVLGDRSRSSDGSE